TRPTNPIVPTIETAAAVIKVDTIKITNLVRFTLIPKCAACLSPNANKFKCWLYAINTMKPIIKYGTNTKVNVQPCIAKLPINQKTIWLTTLSERETSMKQMILKRQKQ